MSTVTLQQPRHWWGRAWQDVLDESGPAGTRSVQRGQALVRRGAVEDLEVVAGNVRGRVRGERGEVRAVEIRIPRLSGDVWEQVTARLADELRFTAALLEGNLPEDLPAVFEQVDARFIPALRELDRRCSCRERGLCRHVAAVHLAAGLLIDRDAFVLIEVRGASRRELLQELRGAGSREGAAGAASLDLSHGLSAARGDLDAIVLQPAPAEDPTALVRHLGPPPGVDDDRQLMGLIERAAGAAWRLAAGDGAAAADEELLLAELRAQRTATPGSLATALGRDAAEIRAELDRLFEAGVVMRTGSGERTRYRAASGRG